MTLNELQPQPSNTPGAVESPPVSFKIKSVFHVWYKDSGMGRSTTGLLGDMQCTEGIPQDEILNFYNKEPKMQFLNKIEDYYFFSQNSLSSRLAGNSPCCHSGTHVPPVSLFHHPLRWPLSA